MAASLALKKLLSKSLLATPNSLGAIRAAASPSIPRRLFNTNAVRRYDDDDLEDVFARRDDLFPGGAFLFGPARSLAEVFNQKDQSSPFLSSLSGCSGDYRRSWGAKESEDGLQLRVDLPGLGKEDVKVSVQHGTLVIEAKGDEEEGKRSYVSRVELPKQKYKIDSIKAEMKNGVLKVVLPKLKEEERANVFHVTID